MKFMGIEKSEYFKGIASPYSARTSKNGGRRTKASTVRKLIQFGKRNALKCWRNSKNDVEDKRDNTEPFMQFEKKLWCLQQKLSLFLPLRKKGIKEASLSK